MKVQIYKESKPEEPVLRLKLVQSFNEVNLIAVDEKGYKKTAGHLLTITGEGKLHICQCVNRELGLDLDSDGKLELD